MFQLNSMLLFFYSRQTVYRKFENPEPLLFLLDCTNLIKPTRNVIYRVFPFVTILRESKITNQPGEA